MMIGPDIHSPTNFQTQNFNKFFIIAVCFNQVSVYVFVNRGCVFSLVSNLESDICFSWTPGEFGFCLKKWYWLKRFLWNG